MQIDNEQQAAEAITGWQQEPPRAQLRYLKAALESLEMSRMYYDQKGNDRGCARCDKCLALIRTRITAVEQTLPS